MNEDDEPLRDDTTDEALQRYRLESTVLRSTSLAPKAETSRIQTATKKVMENTETSTTANAVLLNVDCS